MSDREIRRSFDHGSGLFILIEYDRPNARMRDSKLSWLNSYDTDEVAADSESLAQVEWEEWTALTPRGIWASDTTSTA